MSEGEMSLRKAGIEFDRVLQLHDCLSVGAPKAVRAAEGKVARSVFSVAFDRTLSRRFRSIERRLADGGVAIECVLHLHQGPARMRSAEAWFYRNCPVEHPLGLSESRGIELIEMP